MTSINTSYSAKITTASSNQYNPTKKIEVEKNQTSLKEQLEKQQNNNGLIEKLYDFCKNISGIGLGSKKIKENISKVEKGNLSEDTVKQQITEYHTSQQNAAQNTGDLASGIVGLSIYYSTINGIKEIRSQFKAKALPIPLQILRPQNKNKIEKLINSNKKMAAIVLPLIFITSGLTKWSLLKINRIGSKEFKMEDNNNLDKKQLKKEKKLLKRERHRLNFKNYITGSLNGLLSPITTLVGGIVGVPLYLGAILGTKFAVSKKEDKSNFSNTLKNNLLINTIFAGALTTVAFKKANYNKVLSENLQKVVTKMKGTALKSPEFSSSQNAYTEIRDIILKSDAIKNIMENPTIKPEEAIKKLTDENIFAVKFLQIEDIGGTISEALKENCPASRTMDEAQAEINKLLNSDNYSISKLLGVGTMAESYLAKDKSGKEVCIKILKQGINKEKIQKDKEAIIRLVTKGTPKDKLTKDQEYLLKNIENLADSISKEVDFENELKAAQKLKKHTKIANVVEPISAKPGIYIMEKASGISLDTLTKYYQYELLLSEINNKIKTGKFSEEKAKVYIDEIQDKMKKLKSKSPDFEDFELSSNDIQLLLNKYIEVLTEQFSKLNKNGKTLHADIHPGNIFIDIKALKAKNKNVFTLIDTGNTIDLNKEQSIASMKLTTYINNGNTKDITKYVLDGATLPDNMSIEKANEIVEQELKTLFFDNEHKLTTLNQTNLLELTNNILRKHNILPNDTQLNYTKAKISASKSLKDLADSFINKKFSKLYSGDVQMSDLAKLTFDIGLILTKAQTAEKLQQSKNLSQMSLTEILRNYRNPNMLKTNSEEHLTYKFKQNIQALPEILETEILETP